MSLKGESFLNILELELLELAEFLGCSIGGCWDRYSISISSMTSCHSGSFFCSMSHSLSVDGHGVLLEPDDCVLGA